MKPVYTNNLNAPRMRKAKFSKQVLTKQLWKEFRETSEEFKDISWKDYVAAWDEIAKTIREETVINPLGVKLPYYSGELKLQYMPHKMKAINAHESNQLGEKVNNLNINSRGKVGKIKWERRWAVKRNRMLQFFGFEATREINKLAKRHIDNFPDSLRTARNTLGGFSVWRQFK